MSAARAAERRLEFWAGTIAALITAYSPLVVYARQGLRGVFQFFAADGFYYLAVADSSRGIAGYSYDGEFATNGFHPLWGWLWSAVFELFDPSRAQQVEWVFLACVACVAMGAGLFAASIARATGRFSLALLAAVPGLYAIATPAFNPHYGSIWSFVNGMETALSLLLFGVLTRLLVTTREATPWHRALAAPAAALCLAALSLSRLDDALLVVAAAIRVGWPALRARDFSACAERCLRVAWLPALGVLLFLAYSYAYSGMAIPVSGAAKVHGPVPGLLRNGYASLTTFFPLIDPLGRGGVLWGDQAYRIAQMLVPVAIASVWLLRERAGMHTDYSEHIRSMTSLLALYVLLKGSYNFAAVSLWNQGHWYYPLSIATTNWIGALWVASWLPVETDRDRLLVSIGRLRFGTRAVVPALVGALVLLLANNYAWIKLETRDHDTYFDFWERSAELEAALEEVCPGCGVVELDDGIVAHTLDRRVLSGTGLALDQAGDTARRRGELLDLAWARGYRLLVTIYYERLETDYASADALREGLGRMSFLESQKLENWDFDVAHRDPQTGVRFLSFTPRDSGDTAPATSPKR